MPKLPASPDDGAARAAVDIRDVTHAYSGNPALRGLSWSAPAGRVTAVLGRNGAGKTSVIEMAEGLRRPDSGSIQVLGVEPWNADADHRARVGVMLQDGGLPMGTKPMALLGHLASFYRAPRDVDELAARLEIPSFNRTSVRRLSGGQRQRVWIAMALAQDTPTLLLDEPTTYLDLAYSIEVLSLVRRLQSEQGKTVVMVLHDLNLAIRFSDHLVVLGDGVVAAQGTPQDVVTPELLHEVFGLDALVVPDPATGGPLVVPR